MATEVVAANTLSPHLPSGAPSDVLVLGGGAAGLVAAREAKEAGAASVLCLEKMDRPGLKILVSGGGHCNLTTTLDPREGEPLFGKDGGRFLRRALRETPPRLIREWMHERGVPTIEAEYDKVWPESMKSQDVLDVLLDRLRDSGARLQTGSPVDAIRPPTDEGGTWQVQVGDAWLSARRLILATGGCSYPGMGTVGQGYRWLEELGLEVTGTWPALVGLSSPAAWVKELAGLTLYEVELQLREASGRIARRRARPLLFTHKGVSGPGPMDLSGTIARAPGSYSSLHVDLLPGRRADDLLALLFQGGGELSSTLQRELGLPKRLVRSLLERLGLTTTPPAQVARVDRQALVTELKGMTIPIDGTQGFAKAEVTTGGLVLEHVDPSTMEVRGHPGLYVTGELLDVDGPIGGFSFWMAFATGGLAGRSAGRSVGKAGDDPT